MRDVVVITGSSGLIGSALADALLDRYDVIGFDVKPPSRKRAGVTHVDVDFSSDSSVRDGVAQVGRHAPHLASVVHLAAFHDFSGKDSPLYEQITVRGTERLLTALRDLELEQFIFSSTMLVHAPCRPGERIDEDSPLEPKWAYPQSKVNTENLIQKERGQTPTAILRIAGVYDDRCHSIPIAHQIQRIHENSLTGHFFPGDVTHGQSFLHLADLVDAIRRIVDLRHALPGDLTMLLGEEDTMSYGELQDLVGKLLFGHKWTTIRIPRPMAKVGAWLQNTLPLGGDSFIQTWMVDLVDDHFAVDISRARSLLDWRPSRTLRESLRRMIAALKADPARWYAENRLTPPRWLKGGLQPVEASR